MEKVGKSTVSARARVGTSGKGVQMEESKPNGLLQEHRGGRHYSDEKKADFAALFRVILEAVKFCQLRYS